MSISMLDFSTNPVEMLLWIYQQTRNISALLFIAVMLNLGYALNEMLIETRLSVLIQFNSIQFNPIQFICFHLSHDT